MASSPQTVRFVSARGYDLKKRQDDAAYDLRSTESVIVHFRQRGLVSTGIKLAMPPTMYAQIHPRSGLALRGIDIGAGIIDASYRGELKVVLVNNSDENFLVTPGDRIAQLIFHPLAEVSPVMVNELEDTERGAKGFGSSGLS
jgi:dUTP pyrophosphatase